jgi:hypothetical protein
MSNNTEAHLFIIWEFARYKQKEILNKIENKLRIVEVYDMQWSASLFSNNLTRFYGQKLPKNSFKEKHCGKGRFLLVICEDMNPTYQNRDTISREIEKVNTNIFDLKQEFRKMTGGGHKIHATNNPTETNHDLTLLLGINSHDYDIENKPTWDRRIIRLSRDLPGACGWRSVNDLFYVLNSCEDYVVLRNFEGLPDLITLDEHDDIDFLARNYENFCYLLNGKKVFNKSYRVHYELIIDNQKVLCDVRYTGDGYYDSVWQSVIIETRIKCKNFYIPSNKNHKYSVLYHALIQKKYISHDYMTKIKVWFKNENLDELKVKLDSFMNRNDYKYIEPRDLTVFYNNKKISINRKWFYVWLEIKVFLRSLIKN